MSLAVRATATPLTLCGCAIAGAPTTVHCPEGTYKFTPDSMGKGHYEVIGTLQDGSITMMQTVYMGENFGEQAVRHAICCHLATHQNGLLCLCVADMNMYAEMVGLTHQLPDVF